MKNVNFQLSYSYDDFMALPESERRELFDALIKIYEINLNRILKIGVDVLKNIKEQP